MTNHKNRHIVIGKLMTERENDHSVSATGGSCGRNFSKHPDLAQHQRGVADHGVDAVDRQACHLADLLPSSYESR